MVLTIKPFQIKSMGKFSRIILKKQGASTMKLTGTLTFVPTKQDHDEYGTKFSFGVRFEESDMEEFDQCLETLSQQIKTKLGFEPTTKDFHNDGVIFFKIPVNGEHSKFTCVISPSITPRKLDHSSIQTDEDVMIEFSPSAWVQQVDEESAKCGISCKIKKIQFGPRPMKKKKTKSDDKDEDDEELVSYFKYLLMWN